MMGAVTEAGPRSRILWIVLSGLLLIVGILSATTFMINNLRERALSSSMRELENTVLLLSRHFDQQFAEFSDAQARLVRRLSVADISSPEEFTRRMSTSDIHQLLASEISSAFDNNDVFLFNADGDVVNTSQAGPLPTVNIAQRDYFRAFKFNLTPATTLVSSVRSIFTGKFTTILARKLTGQNGIFLGELSRRIETQEVEQFLEAVVLGNGATITIAHRNGDLIAQFPHVEALDGQNVGGNTVFRQAVSQPGPSTLRVTSPVDGEDRLTSARQMRNFPVIVIATTTTEAALVDWRDQTRLLITVALLLVTVVVALCVLISRRLSRERRLSEQRLALGKQHLDTALDNMSQGLCLFDGDKRTVMSNPRFREIYWFTEDQVKPGVSFAEILGHIAANGGRLDQSISEQTDVQSANPQYVYRFDDGRVVLIRRAPTPDGGWVSTHDDITETERAAAALKAAKETAEAASHAKSDFLAMMSHEVRTPMAGMMGMIDLLAASELDDEQRGLASIAHQSARNLLTVVNNILDFSKLEAGQLTPESISFSVAHSLKAIAQLLGPKASERGLVLETSISADMPERLNGDPSRLGQILLNLAGNAIKFTEAGSVTIAASHRVLADDGIELRIEVADTGMGIPPDVQASLFSPFTQADTSVSRRYGGTGLGLAICKQLCRAMGGDIGVESAPGRGSTFWFTLRCTPGAALEDIPAPPLAPASIDEAGDLHILVAEDNDILRSLISKLLTKMGYHADLVCNGQEAVAAVREKSYDLVLMDMQMPVLDGISAAKAIRSSTGPERNVPIIALTANALVGQRESCLAAGMNSFLTKPIQPDALRSTILKWRPARTQQRHDQRVDA